MIRDNCALPYPGGAFFGAGMSDEKIIIDERTMERTLARLAHEIIEQSAGESVVYLVGIKRRGVPLAKKIAENIRRFSDMDAALGELDITLYRDDLTEEYPQPKVSGTVIGFDVTGKTIVLVDDVIYTGRTARAAMDALISLGRPAAIRLCVMVDRGHRELPIMPNHVGKNVPTSLDEFIAVRVAEIDGENCVAIAHGEGN